MAKVPNGVEKN